MHQILRDLAERGGTRWTRTQVLHYLPKRFHASAARYFDGERLRPPAEQPPEPTPLDAPTVTEALRRARERLAGPVDSAADAPEPTREHLATVAELLGRPEPDGHGPTAQMLRALRAEIRRVAGEAPTRYRLREGRCVNAVAGHFTYKFVWSSEPDPYAPGELVFDQKRWQARVGEADPDRDRCFEVIVDGYLGPTVDAVVFYVDPTFLLRAVHEELRERDELSELPDLVARELLSPPAAMETHPALAGENLAGLNPQQARAVRVALSTRRAYVWGPPGTGKTRSVGALVRSLIASGKRVLVVSPYNVAVDQAVLAVARGSTLGTGDVLRFGRASPEVRALSLDMDSRLEATAAASGLLDTARDLVASIMARAGQRVTPPATMRGCLDELGAWVATSGRARGDAMVAEMTKTLRQLRERFRAPEDEIIERASVVGCTMALSFLSRKLRKRLFDHVVVDEASVVRTPEAVLSVLLGNSAPVTFFGDPKQLPAIVQEQSHLTDEWLGRSPFAMAGISEPHHAVGACVMLEEQHRMAPPIRRIVSELFYAGRLRDGSHAPGEGRVVLVDTSGTGARSTPKMIRLSNSKENLIHRHVVAEAVRAILDSNSHAKVLVLAPFVAQKRAYRREPATARLTRDIRFETIHTSQGTEQDVVVIDFVLAGNGPGTRSRMLDDRMNRSLRNLLNVAISRAQRRLVLVADLELVRREYGDGLFGELLQRAARGGRVVKPPKSLRCREEFRDAL